MQAVPQYRPDGRLHPRFGRSRARAGHHHRRQEHVARLAGRQDQHRRHARPLRLRRRSGARPPDGRRRAAAHRRGGRPSAADPFRAQEGPGAGPPAHRRHQQDRPPGRPDQGGPRRDRRSVHRARGRRRAVELPGHLRLGPERHLDDEPGRPGQRPDPALPVHPGSCAGPGIRSREPALRADHQYQPRRLYRTHRHRPPLGRPGPDRRPDRGPVRGRQAGSRRRSRSCSFSRDWNGPRCPPSKRASSSPSPASLP